MPQMVTPPPAAPQASPKAKVSSQGNKENNKFSPHLKDAISSKKQQQQVVQDKGRKDTSSSSEKKPLIDENSQVLATQQAENNPETSTTLEENPVNTQIAASEQSLFSAVQANTATDSAPAPTQQNSTAADSLLNAATKTGTEATTFRSSPPPESVQPELTPSIAEPEVTKAIQPMTSKGQDALLNQLQSIIDKANETGIVSITKVPNSAFTNSINSNIHGLTTFSSGNAEPVNVSVAAESSGLLANGLLVADAEGVEKAAGKPAPQMDGIRQDSRHQYFNAKINMQNLADNNQNFQENQAGDELPRQPAGSNLPTGLFSAPEQTNTFSQISAAVQETTTQSITESVKPIILPSGTIVHEDEILQQLNQKFQISSRHMDSRINIKLHPVELGALKIDLTVKEGSIRANVVAQSQHTLEILDKNLSKLKAILENQGFTVDEISLTTESDSVSDFDLFDRQMFNHNEYTPTAPKNRRDNEAVFTLADNIFTPPATNTGVNVKI